MVLIEQLLQLPSVIGAILLMVVTTAVGVSIFVLAHRLFAKSRSTEFRRATSGLFRVIGILVSLFLSLTFADVVLELNQIEAAVEREAVMILDVHRDLSRFDSDRARTAQALLVEYTEAVIEHDWPALADDRLSQEARALLWRLEDETLHLEPATSVEQILHSRINSDVDQISDLRLARLEQALAKPPLFLIVVIFGFLATMVCFGPYRPGRLTIGLLSLYTLLVGLVIYMILAFSDPFQGSTSVDPAAIEFVLEQIQ